MRHRFGILVVWIFQNKHKNHKIAIMKTTCDKIIELIESGVARTEVARRLGVHRSTVYRAERKFNMTGMTSRRSGQGRKRSVRTRGLLKALKGRIQRNPIRSMRQMAKDLNVSERTIRRAIRDDLGAKSRARTAKHLISEDSKVKRLDRCKRLLNCLKKSAQVILYSDEKVFTVDAVSSSRTNRYISSERSEDVPSQVKHTFKTKHPASVMVFGLPGS